MKTKRTKRTRRVLIAGTTADYIELISRRYPDSALFLTDSAERASAEEPAPPAPFELICDLSKAGTLSKLRAHLHKNEIGLSGIVCFDCESMRLASRIAREFSLPYVSSETVAACRNKFTSKVIWREAGLPCPKVELIRDAAEAGRFLDRAPDGAVIKPLAGSGSEYVFLCSTKRECASAIKLINKKLRQLRKDPNKPLYSRDRSAAKQAGYAMEEFVRGAEFSCDFAIFGKRLEILRIAEKIPARGRTFGTTLAYIMPGRIPSSFDLDGFKSQLRKAARALGIERAICMLDFIIRDGEAVMLEMTPRPGGDCLPPLILRSSGVDMLKAAIDFSAGRFPVMPDPPEWQRLVGLRLFASEQGVISKLDAERLLADDRVLEFYAKRGPGHKVTLPPDDYDSQLIGHVIFRPSSPDNIEGECLELNKLFKVEMEKRWRKLLKS